MANRNGGRHDGVSNRKRRALLRTAGAVGVVGFAGCLGGENEENGDEENGDENGEPEGEANFEVDELEPGATTVTWQESVTVAATITNTGDAEGETDAELQVAGEVAETRAVTLGPAGSEQVEFALETADLDPGEVAYGVYAGDDDETDTLTVELFGDEPADAFSFDEASGDTLSLSTGVETVTGTVSNPYPFPLESGAIDLAASGDLSVDAADGTSFETLDSSDSQSVAWEVSVPEDAENEEYGIDVEVTYSAGGESVEETHSVTGFVVPSPTVSVEERTVDDLGPSWVHAYATETDGVPTGEGEPTFRFPESDERIHVEDENWDGPDGLAEFYVGYDSDRFYVRAEVTDEEHNSVPGTGMWEGDSLQFATATGPTLDWGAEYGARHDEEAGEAQLVQYDGGEADGDQSEIDAETSREDGTTVYELAIPWNAFVDAAPEPGDVVPFGDTVQEREDDTEWAGAYSWSDFAVFSPKSPENLGRITLEDDGDELPWEVALVPEGPGELESGEEGSWSITVVNWAQSEQEIELEIGDVGVEDTIVVDGGSAVDVTVDWLLIDNQTLSVDFDNGRQTYTSEISVVVD